MMPKLVRDKIPEIITENNGIPNFRTLTPKEFDKEIIRKMHEETDEYASSGDLEELADMYEVLCAMVKQSAFTMNQVVARACEKRVTHGAFDKRIYLESCDYA